jgi:hypothetical protein
MKGRPLRPLGAAIVFSKAAGFLGSLSFIAFLASAVLSNSPETSLALWILFGGFTAASIYPPSLAASRLINIFRSLDKNIALRPLFTPLTGAFAALAVPPIAPLIAYSMLLSMLDVIDKLTADYDISVEDLIRHLPGDILSPKFFVVSSIIPIVLPLAVTMYWRNVFSISCAMLDSLRRRGLWDKPCTSDFIEIMIWSQPHSLAFNSKLLAEKWSIKD